MKKQPYTIPTGRAFGRGLDSLGQGLDALIKATPAEAVGSKEFDEISIDQIHPNPNQPRREFDDEAIAELAASIKVNGIISPITLRRISNDNFQIIAGERRYRAANMVGLEKIPAYIRDVDDDKVLEMALIENIQREDLNAIETALAYNNLASALNLTQEALAERVGKKRATVTNYLRLLKLPSVIQAGIKDKNIDMGHARALAGLEDPELQIKAYEIVIAEGASVRRTEEIVKNIAAEQMPDTPKQPKQAFRPEEYNMLRDSLAKLFDSKVKLNYNDKGKGSISIPFSSDQDLQRILALFDRIQNK